MTRKLIIISLNAFYIILLCTVTYSQTYSDKQLDLIEENEQAIINEVYISRLFRQLMSDYSSTNWMYLDFFGGKGPEISANNFFDWDGMFFGFQVYAFNGAYNERGQGSGRGSNAGANLFTGYNVYLDETTIFTGIYMTVNGNRRSEEEIENYEYDTDEDVTAFLHYLSPYFFIKNPILDWLRSTFDAVFDPFEGDWLTRFGAALILDMMDLMDIRGLETSVEYDTVKIFHGWQHDFGAVATQRLRDIGISGPGGKAHARIKYGYIINMVDEGHPLVENNSWESHYVLLEINWDGFYGGVSYRQKAGPGIQAGARSDISDDFFIDASLQWNYVFESMYGQKINPLSFFFSMGMRWE